MKDLKIHGSVAGKQGSKNGILFLFFCLLIALSGCEKEDEPYFSLSESEIAFVEKGEQQTVEVRSNIPWQASVSPAEATSWLTLSADGGEGGDVTLTLTATANDESGDRSATVSFNSATGTKTLRVTQKVLARYEDKHVKKLQSATTGKGINLVVMGDGFTKNHLAKDGPYEELMKQTAECFFSVEPYKSYRDYFNVYMVVAESEEAGANYEAYPGEKVNTKFNCTFGEGTEIKCDNAICNEYAALVPGVEMDSKKQILTECLVIMAVNSVAYAGTTTMYSNGYSVALCPVSQEDPPNDFEGLIHHEAGGHGFGLFIDEYVYHNETLPDEYKEEVRVWKQFPAGFYSNVDLTNDPEQVGWKDFIGNLKYLYVGTYEGGALYRYGIWRPEEYTCMDINIPYFSAPSRWAIVNRIMRLAGTSMTLVEFMSRDNVTPPVLTRSIASGRKMPPLGRPQMIKVDSGNRTE